MEHWSDSKLEQEAVVTEELILEKDLFDHFLGASDEQGPAQFSFGVESRSCVGGPPLSLPIRVITSAKGGNADSAASSTVAEMNPWELMPTGSLAESCPASSAASRYKVTNGLNRSAVPPMIANDMGSPRRPARTTEAGVPPVAIHTGIGSWTGRG